MEHLLRRLIVCCSIAFLSVALIWPAWTRVVFVGHDGHPIGPGFG